MKAFGNYVVQTNDGNGWVIEGDEPNGTLVTRKRGREIKAAYENVLKNADKPFRVRVVPSGLNLA